MHSYILANFQSQPDISKKINQLCQINLGVEDWQNHPDIIIINPEINQNTINKTASIKINTIRKLTKKLNQKPLQLKQNIAIINDADTLTLAAQNSFLKLLEETPHSQIFLISNNFKSLIPTIRSRCQLIISPSLSNFKIDKKYLEEFEVFQKASPTKRLKLIESYQKTPIKSKEFLIQYIHIIRQLLKQSKSNSNLILLLKNLKNCYQDINRNVNRKLALDHLCLVWDKK